MVPDAAQRRCSDFDAPGDLAAVLATGSRIRQNRSGLPTPDLPRRFYMPADWIADRMRHIDASGIRKVFDLAANMPNPINLSIGQPHFDTPEPVKQALYRAV